MGNKESGPGSSQLTAQNISRASTLDADAPPFQPRFARSDTTTAQAGSPSRDLLDDEQPLNKKHPNTSCSSVNSSFLISESALPETFDISGDLPSAQLSHYFPLPATEADTSGSQKSFATIATLSDFPPTPSLHQSSMPSTNGPKGLQETLDALWAPPKNTPVRISLPPTPLMGTNDSLIDFSDSNVMPNFPTMPSSSAESSFEKKISTNGLPSATQSGDASNAPPEMRRSETLTQLLANHPELDFGPLQSSPKRPIVNDTANSSGSVTSILLSGDKEPIQLPPVTYADATNIASQYPELAEKVLTEPLATPVQVNKMLEPDDEAAEYAVPHAPPPPAKEPAPAMPAHTWENPNWALVPAQPEDYLPRPVGGRRGSSFVQPDRGGGGGYGRKSAYDQALDDFNAQRGGDRSYGGDRHGVGDDRRGGGDGRRQSAYDQAQGEFDAQWGHDGGDRSRGGDRRGGDDRRGGGSAPRYQQSQDEFDAQWGHSGGDQRGGGDDRRGGGGGRGHDEQEDYVSARNGPQRRGWAQEPGYNSGGNGRDGHDAPPHMRRGARGGDDSYGGGGGEQRSPARPSATHADSWNASAARVDEPATSSGGGGADEWSGTERDAWGAPTEPKQDARAAPAAPPAQQQQDAWGAPAEPAQDAWDIPAAPPAQEKREAPARDAWGVPAQVESHPAPQVEAVEWESTHDPWTAPAAPAAAVRSTSKAPAPPPPQSQSFHEEKHVVSHREEVPSANEWTASHDPWASGGNENQNQNLSQQQSQKQLEPENKREAPASIRGATSPFRDRINDNQTSDRSNEGSFSANVLDVRAPSQASVAALAASRTNDTYDRSGPQSGRENDAPGQLPVEFNYFLHSETVDWLNSGPTNNSQNSFSPSQNLVTPVRELTPSARAAVREQSQVPEIKAPAPRNTDYFDYNQQPSEQSGGSWGSAGGAQSKGNRGADVSTSGGVNWGAPASGDNWGVAGGAQSTENRSADVPTSGGDNWGASDGAAHRTDRMQGNVDDSFVLGSMKSDRYESRQQDYHRRPSESQWGPSGGDDNRGPFDSFGNGRGGSRGRSPGHGGRGGNDYDRGVDGGRDDYGGRGGDYGRRDDRGGNYGRGGGDRHDRSEDYGRGGGDRHDRGGDYGRRGGDEYGRGGDYGRRGGNDYGRRDGGRRDDFDNGAPMNKYGGAGPLPTPYSGPPRRTSYGMSNFELPPVDYLHTYFL